MFLISNPFTLQAEALRSSKISPFLFPTYLGRSKGLCSQGRIRCNRKIKLVGFSPSSMNLARLRTLAPAVSLSINTFSLVSQSMISSCTFSLASLLFNVINLFVKNTLSRLASARFCFANSMDFSFKDRFKKSHHSLILEKAR